MLVMQDRLIRAMAVGKLIDSMSHGHQENATVKKLVWPSLPTRRRDEVLAQWNAGEINTADLLQKLPDICDDKCCCLSMLNWLGETAVSMEWETASEANKMTEYNGMRAYEAFNFFEGEYKALAAAISSKTTFWSERAFVVDALKSCWMASQFADAAFQNDVIDALKSSWMASEIQDDLRRYAAFQNDSQFGECPQTPRRIAAEPSPEVQRLWGMEWKWDMSTREWVPMGTAWHDS